MPSSRTTGRISASMLRLISEYSICSALIGWTAAAQRVAQQHFAPAHAVEVSGVQQGDPRVQGRADGGDALRVVRLAVDAGHAHQAEPGPGHLRPAAAQRRLAQWCLAQWRLAQWCLAQWRLAQWCLAQWCLAQWCLLHDYNITPSRRLLPGRRSRRVLLRRRSARPRWRVTYPRSSSGST